MCGAARGVAIVSLTGSLLTVGPGLGWRKAWVRWCCPFLCFRACFVCVCGVCRLAPRGVLN